MVWADSLSSNAHCVDAFAALNTNSGKYEESAKCREVE